LAKKGIRWMQLSHPAPTLSAVFDEPNLISCAGLAPVWALAQHCGLAELVDEHLTLKGAGGVNAPIKVPALVAGMVAGADSIADLDLLRHGGMGRLFAGIRAPSTLGTFLRTFTFGHVRQLDAIAARLLARLTAASPVLPGAGERVFVDVDDTICPTYGYAKQGAGRGYNKVKGINALLATICSSAAAPVIAATRLRRGAVNSARGAARCVADALAGARRAGVREPVLRADSAFYTAEVIGAARRGGARFSVTARMTATVKAAISAIAESAWTPIRYPNAIWDEEEQRWISDAEVAEVPFTAFTSHRRCEQVTARLIVRRVKRLNPARKLEEPFATWRFHPVFTDSDQPMLAAESEHRGHAVVEQVHADLKAGPLAHLPRGCSPRTPPGWRWRRWRSTSSAPPGRWPRPFMPGPPPRRSAPS
jgi:hypothetical protein